MAKDVGNPEQVKVDSQKAATRDKRITNGLTLVLSHPDSRLWLYSMLEEAGPFRNAFTGNSGTFLRCGEQAWAQRLIAIMLDSHLENYVRMMKEGKADG